MRRLRLVPKTVIIGATTLAFWIGATAIQAESCSEEYLQSTEVEFHWPLAGQEGVYDKALLPFGDSWCNHRIKFKEEFQTSTDLLSPEIAFERRKTMTCWGVCINAQKAWQHMAIDIRRHEDPLQIGVDSTGVIVGSAVTPIYPGVVREVQFFSNWKGALVMEHKMANGCLFTSVYWHLENVDVEACTSTDFDACPVIGIETRLGRVADIENSSPEVMDIDHLHLGIRRGSYTSNISLAGALPPASSGCGFDHLPAASEQFMDPAGLRYRYRQFSDISCSDSKWFTNPVLKMAADGIVQGYPDGLFLAEQVVSRAEFLKMALLAAGHNVPETPGEWYERFLVYARNEGIVSQEEFRPGDSITRAEAVVILVESFGALASLGPFQAFDDVPPNAPYEEHLRAAMVLGVIEGYPEDGARVFRPSNTLNRAEAAKILCKSKYRHGECDLSHCS